MQESRREFRRSEPEPITPHAVIRATSALPKFSDSRSEPWGPDRIPDGYRTMTPAEGDELQFGDTVLLFDRADQTLSVWRVQSFTSWGWRVVHVAGESSRASLRLDDDDPAFWGEADIASGRQRRGLEAECRRYVAIVRRSSDPEGDR
jgi:hypothetical protein